MIRFQHRIARIYARPICLGISLMIVGVARPVVSHAAPPVAISPYTLTTLTQLVPPAGATQPDDLAVSAAVRTSGSGTATG
jgi:hypothetical protein